MQNTPTIFVIFGATGDLAEKKLFPALFDLYRKNLLPKKFRIVALGRKEFNDNSFRKMVDDVLADHSDTNAISSFLKIVAYFRGVFDKEDTYASLSKHLSGLDKELGACSNKLFYLSTPPSLYELILKHLSRSGLTIPCGGDKGWTRIIVEKPFGRDSKTAARLDSLLGSLFEEEQIFRIDHYLAKETLQNILTFRFSNTIFEPLWSGKHIDLVEINLFETTTMGRRGPFYDGIGALRDVGQNHLLAMLALVAMEKPESLAANAIREARENVLAKLSPVSARDLGKRVFRAQYEDYRGEAGVKADSDTETFFSLKAFVKNRRFKGVPFILTSGKAFREAKAEIKIHFKDPDPTFFLPEQLPEQEHNTLTFSIQPNEGIAINFWAKVPGFEKKIEQKNLSFKYTDLPSEKILPDAYERVIFDCILGDQTLFASTKEIEAEWKFITPILKLWNALPLHTYKAGSDGPKVLFN